MPSTYPESPSAKPSITRHRPADPERARRDRFPGGYRLRDDQQGALSWLLWLHGQTRADRPVGVLPHRAHWHLFLWQETVCLPRRAKELADCFRVRQRLCRQLRAGIPRQQRTPAAAPRRADRLRQHGWIHQRRRAHHHRKRPDRTARQAARAAAAVPLRTPRGALWADLCQAVDHDPVYRRVVRKILSESMIYDELLHSLHFLRDAYFPRARIHAGHLHALAAAPCALGDPKPQLFQCPVVFSEMKILILAEQCMDLRSVRADAPLTSVTRDRRVLLFQHGEHLVKVRNRHSRIPGIPSQGGIHLFLRSESDQNTRNRVGQRKADQRLLRKPCGKEPCRVHLVDQKPLFAQTGKRSFLSL